MPDNSSLDSKYFIDSHVFNCPFCNRRNVSYIIISKFNFDWTDSKKCYVYLAKCKSCNCVSMHMTFEELELHIVNYGYRFEKDEKNLDNIYFYSIPTSFFTVNSNIPKDLRELFSEAEGCLKSNFLTGASGCLRKIVYELAIIEGAEGSNYDDRIRSLKKIKTDIDPVYFETLLTIQQLTSDKVHENSYDNWESKYVRLILASLLEILNEIYVIPAIRNEKRKAILDLKSQVLNKKKKSKNRNNL